MGVDDGHAKALLRKLPSAGEAGITRSQDGHVNRHLAVQRGAGGRDIGGGSVPGVWEFSLAVVLKERVHGLTA